MHDLERVQKKYDKKKRELALVQASRKRLERNNRLWDEVVRHYAEDKYDAILEQLKGRVGTPDTEEDEENEEGDDGDDDSDDDGEKEEEP